MKHLGLAVSIAVLSVTLSCSDDENVDSTSAADADDGVSSEGATGFMEKDARAADESRPVMRPVDYSDLSANAAVVHPEPAMIDDVDRAREVSHSKYPRFMKKKEGEKHLRFKLRRHEVGEPSGSGNPTGSESPTESGSPQTGPSGENPAPGSNTGSGSPTGNTGSGTPAESPAGNTGNTAGQPAGVPPIQPIAFPPIDFDPIRVTIDITVDPEFGFGGAPPN